jgi:hypothetical protein
MSFLELWDSFDAVKEHWNSNKSMLESYLELIKLRAELEKSACKRLEKITQCHFFRMGKNTLVPVIEKLCSVYTSKLKASRLCYNMISNEIMQPLKDLLHSQESKIKEKSEQCKRLENERKKAFKALETLKEKYWKHCKESILNNKSRLESTAKESSSLESYVRQIDSVNKFNVNYVEEMGRHLAIFQISEEERLKHLRESLKKLHEAEALIVNGIVSEMEEVPLVNYK